MHYNNYFHVHACVNECTCEYICIYVCTCMLGADKVYQFNVSCIKSEVSEFWLRQ